MNVAQVDAIVNQAKIDGYGLLIVVDEGESTQQYIIDTDQICSIDRNPPGLLVVKLFKGELMCIDNSRIVQIRLIPRREGQVHWMTL